MLSLSLFLISDSSHNHFSFVHLSFSFFSDQLYPLSLPSPRCFFPHLLSHTSRQFRFLFFFFGYVTFFSFHPVFTNFLSFFKYLPSLSRSFFVFLFFSFFFSFSFVLFFFFFIVSSSSFLLFFFPYFLLSS